MLLRTRSRRPGRRASSILSFFLLSLAAIVACSRAGAVPELPSPTPTLPPPEATTVAEDAIISDVAEAEAAAAPPAVPLPLAWSPEPLLREGAPPPPRIGAKAAVVLDEASLAVLYDKDAHAPLPPASLTKIVTLILAIEEGNLDDWIETDIDSREMIDNSIMGLLPGDTYTLRDLVYGMMLLSGNDAALAIARHLAGSETAFVERMNTLVQGLGLHESRFSDPHGFDDIGNSASAYDLALLARYGMSLPGFSEVVSKELWQAEGSRPFGFENTNTFLYRYDGADGVKTGFTDAAGPTLVASATRNGHRLYAVILNAPVRNQDAAVLLNWAFDNYVWS